MTTSQAMTLTKVLTALNAVSTIDRGRPVGPDRIHGLLYYAQGFWLASGEKPLFEEAFVPTTFGLVLPAVERIYSTFEDDVVRANIIYPREVPELEPGVLAHLRAIVAEFGGWSGADFAAAVRSERPWRDVAEDAPYGSVPEAAVGVREIHECFAEMTESGEDAMDELDVAADPDRAWWVKPFSMAVDLKRLVDHPRFDDVRSRMLRLELGFDEFPGSVSEGKARRPRAAAG